ncbi:hypothetical protein LC092_03290 [Stappia stellulata]|uniref:hypothetical protein n=1 Tax=Stappia stellulata TaxID=71235 RepID=UPI001CD5A5FB|nr:hypothetical protein [Stappia stellulata]MCA1241457.1 hypothetical protein [Stappia stellulata]
MRRDPTNAPRVPLVRVSYFVWVIVPVAAWLGIAAVGLPHVIWFYDWQPLGPDSYGDPTQRHYTRCSYLGPYGRLTERPADGRCGWLRFVRDGEARP